MAAAAALPIAGVIGAIDPTSDLARNVASYGGSAGRRWLEALPARVAALTGRWALVDVEPFDGLTFNYVARARRGSRAVVLKIGWEDLAIRRERAWLRHFRSSGVVEIVADDGDDAYLMQCLDPGESVVILPEASATEAIGHAIHSLGGGDPSIPTAPTYPTLDDWFSALPRASPAARNGLGARLDRAGALVRELQQPGERRLLHGDLHHTNVLNHADTWVVTDPHGVIGDPAHECAAMLRNALPLIDGDLGRGVRRRVDGLAALTGYDARRIRDWGYAQNVLSCVWSLDADAHADVTDVVAVIDALAT